MVYSNGACFLKENLHYVTGVEAIQRGSIPAVTSGTPWDSSRHMGDRPGNFNSTTAIGTKDSRVPSDRMIHSYAEAQLTIAASDQYKLTQREVRLQIPPLFRTAMLKRISFGLVFLSSVVAQKIVDLSGKHWTLTDQQGNVTVPGAVPSNAYLDLFAAKVIPDPLYGTLIGSIHKIRHAYAS